MDEILDLFNNLSTTEKVYIFHKLTGYIHLNTASQLKIASCERHIVIHPPRIVEIIDCYEKLMIEHQILVLNYFRTIADAIVNFQVQRIVEAHKNGHTNVLPLPQSLPLLQPQMPTLSPTPTSLLQPQMPTLTLSPLPTLSPTPTPLLQPQMPTLSPTPLLQPQMPTLSPTPTPLLQPQMPTPTPTPTPLLQPQMPTPLLQPQMPMLSPTPLLQPQMPMPTLSPTPLLQPQMPMPTLSPTPLLQPQMPMPTLSPTPLLQPQMPTLQQQKPSLSPLLQQQKPSLSLLLQPHKPSLSPLISHPILRSQYRLSRRNEVPYYSYKWNKDEKEILIDSYNNDPYLRGLTERERLSNVLQVSVKRIEIWFRNNRAQERREGKKIPFVSKNDNITYVRTWENGEPLVIVSPQ